MYYQRLSDDEIIEGFREGDSDIIREYFYGYCEAGYRLFDQRYQLSGKQNLDFMSLAHQYAIYLMEHNWKPLEDHSPEVSLKTWLIGGFRYVVLDADNLRLQFNRIVEDICDHAPLDRWDRLIITMMLIRGFKGKEVAAECGITPSAVSQRYNKLKDEIIVPYFRKNFDMDLDMPEVMDERTIVMSEAMMEEITELLPNEIFVFGSNLKGMHGGGAAYIAYRKFGAIMGQGVGLQGQSYAIPTMQGGVETIKPYVDEFIEFAKENKNLTFLVTRIGCGIAGFTDDEISPLFEQAHDVENIVLPPNW